MRERMNQQAIDQYREMFSTPGWRQFLADILDKKDTLEHNALYTLVDLSGLSRAKGVAQAYNYVLSFESLVRQQENVMGEIKDLLGKDGG